MDEKQISLQQVGVRWVQPLIMSWTEYNAVIFTLLDLGPEALTDQLKPFGCPDCSYGLINGYILRQLCQSAQSLLKNEFTLTNLLFKRKVNWSDILLLSNKTGNGEEIYDGKKIKEICRVLLNWLGNDYPVIRVSEFPSECKHEMAFQCDEELYGLCQDKTEKSLYSNRVARVL